MGGFTLTSKGLSEAHRKREHLPMASVCFRMPRRPKMLLPVFERKTEVTVLCLPKVLCSQGKGCTVSRIENLRIRRFNCTFRSQVINRFPTQPLTSPCVFSNYLKIKKEQACANIPDIRLHSKTPFTQIGLSKEKDDQFQIREMP